MGVVGRGSQAKRALGCAVTAVGLLLCLPGQAASTAGSTEYRPITGQGNNQRNPSWGTPGIALLRGSTGSHYGDGISTPGGANRVSPRAVSNAVCAQTESLPNSFGLSDYLWTWGQFLDHDLGLTEGTNESFPIAMPKGDPFFDPESTGSKTMPFNRGLFDPTTGNTSPRAQINEITGFIDGSMVYGSSDSRSTWLRTFSGGKLKGSASPHGDLLPFNDGTVPNAGSPEKPDLSTSLFVAGDIRANEQPTLAIMHTLFVREHNRLAQDIATARPGLSDEEVFQRARRIVIAEIQHVTYDEFVPALLGEGALPPYRGYEPDTNPSLSIMFSGAAFRLGHTLLSPLIQRLNEDGSSIAEGPLSLRSAFFNATPPVLSQEGLEPLLRGLAAQRAQDLDIRVIDDVRNFLFGAPGDGGLDLISMNIQRGRDFGLPDFNTLRTEQGLRRKHSFAAITSNNRQAAALASVYANVSDIDPFVGLLIEDDMPDKIMGETLFAVLVDQFTRSRAGDRFWYERSLSSSDLAFVKDSSLSDIIKRNTSIRHLQKHVFFVRKHNSLASDE